ncbi:MAG: UvrD-helicase domain-containing protein [Chlamydiales bacterium]|nr:UvrD-helicase domain-containing protein [Chlamydiales bacterium]
MSEGLNPQQQEAVNHIEGPALVLAGAGSGKTRIITFRIAHLLSLGVPASDILAVTFTNKAAGEMRERIHKLTHQSVQASTYHSLCAKILRESIDALGFQRDFVIFDEDDSEKVLKECLIALHCKEEKSFLKTAKLQISTAKNQLLEPEKVAEEDDFTGSLYRLYQQKLKEYNALDFDDLLFLSVKLFRTFPEILERYQKRWRFVLIDEYQDTNTAQYLLTKLLSDKHQNVFAVGDPDQSIYSWRGADVHNILNFERDFPGAKIISLEQNYRSRKNILDAANALIENNTGRFEKNLWSDRGEGEKVGIFVAENERAETDFVMKRLKKHHEDEMLSLSDCVIFYRTHFQSRAFEDALLRERIPYVIIGGLSFYQRREVKDILAFLRLTLGGSDFISFARTINLPKRGFGEATIASLRTFAQESGVDILSACMALVERRGDFKLSQRQYDGLKSYVSLIQSLREMVQLKVPLHELVSHAIERSSYIEMLKEDPETYQERRENLEELVSKAAEWERETDKPTLAAFLEELSLKSAHDDKNQDIPAVRLMTLHNSKGLEFALVFIVGMEEELFPHANSLGSSEALEEERRLCYVGMTRAREFLYLTSSRYRFLWGVPRNMNPSRFLEEIPSNYVQLYHKRAAPEREIDPFEEESGFAVGQEVLHRDFGVGIIERSYQTSYGLTYDLFFPQANARRTLIAKFAKLVPVA